MSEIQQKIEEILRKRRTCSDKCKAQLVGLKRLSDSFTELKENLSDNVYPEFEDTKNLIFSRIDEIEKNITKVREKAEYLQKRFERQTVNLGVAGVTHAGKSTLLQAISGLSDNEIPKADKSDKNYGNPTTAVHSEIYNSPKKEAIVFFRTTSEFIAHINEYLEQLGKHVSTMSQFEKLDLGDIKANLSAKSEDQYNYDRIKGIWEALDYFKGYLDRDCTTITDFSQLKKFVAYSNDSVADRIYPAVKIVKIYCPFNVDPADVKLGLIDLPGFGENSNVDKQMVNGLENDVDNVVLIYRPTQTVSGIRAEERKSFDKLNDVQTGIKKRENFLNILVNVDDDLGDLKDNSVNLTLEQIEETLCQNGKYHYDRKPVNALNTSAVQTYVTDVVKKMSTSLSEIDNDLIEYYETVLIKPVKDSIANLVNELKKVTALKGGDQMAENDDIDEKADELQTNIANFLIEKKLQHEALNNREDKPVLEIIADINRSNKETINKNLFHDEFQNYDELKQNYVKAALAGQGYGEIRDAELLSIWRKLLNTYNRLNDYYQEQLEKFKVEILTVFKSNTGNFVPTLEGSSEEIINQILMKLANKDERLKSDVLYEVFDYLRHISYSFTQNLYPYLIDKGITKIMNALYNPEARGEDNNANSSPYDLANDLVDKLNSLTMESNSRIIETLNTYDCFGAYLVCVIEQFNYHLTNKDKKAVRKSYKHFVMKFKDEIFPDEYADVKK